MQSVTDTEPTFIPTTGHTAFEAVENGTMHTNVAKHAAWVTVVGTMFLSVAGVVGLPSNCLILVAHSYRQVSSARVGVAKSAMTSFTVSCLLISAVYVPLSIYYVTHPQAFSGDVVLCRVLDAVHGYCMLSHVFSLLLLTVRVYLDIAHPLRAIVVLTSRWYRFLCPVLTWVLPGVLLCLMVASHWLGPPGQNICLDESGDTAYSVFIAVMAFGIVMPAILTAFALEFRIMCIARKRALEMLQRAAELARTGNDAETARRGTSPRESDQQEEAGNLTQVQSVKEHNYPVEARAQIKQWKGHKKVLLMLSTLMCTWVPAMIIMGMYALCPDCTDSQVSMMLLCLAFAHSSTVPLQFHLLSKGKRQGLVDVLHYMVKACQTQR